MRGSAVFPFESLFPVAFVVVRRECAVVVGVCVSCLSVSCGVVTIVIITVIFGIYVGPDTGAGVGAGTARRADAGTRVDIITCRDIICSHVCSGLILSGVSVFLFLSGSLLPFLCLVFCTQCVCVAWVCCQ